MKNAAVTLTVGANVCTPQGQLKTASITPEDPDVLRYQTLATDGELTQIGPVHWSADLAGVQSYTDATALAGFLLSHAGQKGVLRIQMHGELVAPATTTPAMELDVICVPTMYGGDTQTWAEFEVTLPGIGAPRMITVGP
jgi:hypothetical protein